jgi:hypothetical protein
VPPRSGAGARELSDVRRRPNGEPTRCPERSRDRRALCKRRDERAVWCTVTAPGLPGRGRTSYLAGANVQRSTSWLEVRRTQVQPVSLHTR